MAWAASRKISRNKGLWWTLRSANIFQRTVNLAFLPPPINTFYILKRFSCVSLFYTLAQCWWMALLNTKQPFSSSSLYLTYCCDSLYSSKPWLKLFFFLQLQTQILCFSCYSAFSFTTESIDLIALQIPSGMICFQPGVLGVLFSFSLPAACYTVPNQCKIMIQNTP